MVSASECEYWYEFKRKFKWEYEYEFDWVRVLSLSEYTKGVPKVKIPTL